MSDTTAGGANAGAIEAWNTVLYDKFIRFRWVATNGLGVHGAAAIERLGPKRGEKVLDLGCGIGDTTVALGHRVGPEGLAFGVDAAARFIETAAAEAKEAGLGHVRYAAKDVQVDDLGGPYDAAFSRFGVMFFASPVAAFKNVKKALRPGARLSMSVWRKREDNEWLYVAQQLVEELVPRKEPADAVTCGPGPFSMIGPDLVSEQLQKAGLVRVSFERHDAPICIGRDVAEALEFAMALGPAGEILRLAGEDGEKMRPRVLSALKEAFTRFLRPDGTVWADSSAWIVRAETPA